MENPEEAIVENPEAIVENPEAIVENPGPEGEPENQDGEDESFVLSMELFSSRFLKFLRFLLQGIEPNGNEYFLPEEGAIYTKLECQQYFQRLVIDDEAILYMDSRILPRMKAFYAVRMELLSEEFYYMNIKEWEEIFNEEDTAYFEQCLAKGVDRLPGGLDSFLVRSNFLAPLRDLEKLQEMLSEFFKPTSSLFYCYLCETEVTAEGTYPDHICPQCNGWSLIVMNPENSTVAFPPPNWSLHNWMYRVGYKTLNIKGDIRTVAKVKAALSHESKHTVQCKELYECPVCLEEFEEGADLEELLCGHQFCDTCITRHFTEQNRSRKLCPICKCLLLTVDEPFNVYLRALHIRLNHH